MKWLLVEKASREEDEKMKDIGGIDLDSLVLNIVDDELAEEGVGNTITYGLLAFMLGSAGIVNAAELDRNMAEFARGRVHGNVVNVTKTEMKDIVEKSRTELEMVGKWRKDKALNVLARTLYMEDRSEGREGLRRIMTVIWNRAGGDKTRFADECLRKDQFSCWKELPDSKRTPEGFQIDLLKKDKNTPDGKAWEICMEIARDAFDGKFTPDPQIGNRNIYSHPKDSNTAKNTWGKLCDLKIGVHTFGYDRSQDGFRKYGKKTKTKTDSTQIASVKTKNHTVKDGETIWSIAGKKMSVVNQIKALNGLKSDTIKPGQTLKIPA